MSSVANYFTLWVNARIPVGTSHANIVWKECETLHLTVYCIKPSFRASCLGQITLRQPPLLFWQERTWRLTSCIWPNLHRTTSLFLPFLQFYILPSREKKKKISNDVMHDLYILGLKVRVFTWQNKKDFVLVDVEMLIAVNCLPSYTERSAFWRKCFSNFNIASEKNAFWLSNTTKSSPLTITTLHSIG